MFSLMIVQSVVQMKYSSLNLSSLWHEMISKGLLLLFWEFLTETKISK